MGEPFPLVVNLKLVASIDDRLFTSTCACGQAAQYTARITPIGATMVGELGEDYATCCGHHFRKTSCYHNPHLSLANPEQASSTFHTEILEPFNFFFRREKYCAALCAARLTLKAGYDLINLVCPRCSKSHLDEFKFATQLHHIH